MVSVPVLTYLPLFKMLYGNFVIIYTLTLHPTLKYIYIINSQPYNSENYQIPNACELCQFP